MISVAVAVLLSPMVQTPSGPTAKSLIEKMLGRYHSAQTLSGKIKLTVSAQGGSATLDTEIQYQRPASLYIRQTKNVADPDPGQPTKWLVTSDGVSFSYNVPNERYESSPGLRLAEPVYNARVGISHTIASIYTAAGKSLGDRSMPLDVAIARTEDLIYRRAQWATYRLTGSKQINGKSAHTVLGDFRPYSGAPTIGKFQMAITESGDLLQYVEETVMAVGEGNNPQQVKIVSQWDVDLKVDAKVDPSLFKVVIR